MPNFVIFFNQFYAYVTNMFIFLRQFYDSFIVLLPLISITLSCHSYLSTQATQAIQFLTTGTILVSLVATVAIPPQHYFVLAMLAFELSAITVILMVSEFSAVRKCLHGVTVSLFLE